MDTFEIGKVTGAIVLYTTKGVKRDQTFPIKFRITHRRDAKYINSGFSLSEIAFNRLFGYNHETGRKYALSLEERDTKKLIVASFMRIKEEVESIHLIEEYSHEALSRRLKKGRGTILIDAFKEKIAELAKNGQAGTAASYTTAMRFLTKYQSGVSLTNITPQWLERFEVWAINKEGVNETTLGIYLRCLRTLFNDAIRNGVIQRGAYPFHSKDTKGYRIPQGEGTKIALTIDQVKAITSLELAGSMERCRDIFLLSFHLGGVNFKDLLMLKWKCLRNNEVNFVREKTKHTTRTQKSISVPLTEPAIAIIERWGNPDKSPESYVIPYLTDGLSPERNRDKVKYYTRLVNRQLEGIGKMLNIDGLTTYVARHTFATILKNSGAPITFISETLGHTSIKTTQSYLKSFESEQKRKHFEVIASIGK